MWFLFSFYPNASEPSTNFKNSKLVYFKMSHVELWFHNKSYCPLSLGDKMTFNLVNYSVEGSFRVNWTWSCPIISKHRFFFSFFFWGGGRGGGFGGSRITKPAFVLAKKDITSLATRSKKPLYGWAKRTFSNHVIKWRKVTILTKILWASLVIRNSEIDGISAGTFIV